MSDAKERIDALVKANDVVLFMKGTRAFPAMRLFQPGGRDPRSSGRAVRDGRRAAGPGNPPRHQGIFRLADIPQLYVKGEFVGGSDIMMEMFESGELQQLVAAEA